MSIRNLTTLKGVFPQPKPPPKRDFIRENKLKLRPSDQKSEPLRRNNVKNDECATKYTQCWEKGRGRMIPSNRISSGCSCGSKKSVNSGISAKTIPPKGPVNCDKAIQTDDIVDEVFLANALRKIITEPQLDNYEQAHSRHSRENYQNAKSTQCLATIDENSLAVDLSELNDDNRLSETEELILRKPILGNDFQKSNSEDKVQNRVSHRSDTRTKKDIRIPKYLEREKREKELQRIREMEKDPHCPEGHSVLSDDDRKATLTAAENKFRDLVNELNRMPMSGETLRIRTRKMEIEKALMDLENTIRKFSKSKVYVKTNN